MIKKLFYILITVLFLFPVNSFAQEIDFGSFGGNKYELIFDELNLDDLTFEGDIEAGSGIHEVALIDAKTLSITGIKYLDVFMTIEGDGVLYLDGNINDTENQIPFTLKAAYLNNGQNSPTDGIMIPIAKPQPTSINSGTARFPILERQSLPPGPPPTPPANDFNQTPLQETAYLYLYGEIDVGNVAAGQYSGTITVTISYTEISN